MKNNLEEYYIKILGNPSAGSLEDLERKYALKAKQFRHTKDVDGFHISAVQENGEIIAAYNYLKTLWGLPGSKKRKRMDASQVLLSISRSISKNNFSSLEHIHRKLKLFTKSALILVSATASFQFLIFGLGIPSMVPETESQEIILAKAIMEEEYLRPFRKKENNVFDHRHSEIVPELTTKEQPELIKATRNCRTDQVKSILSDTSTSSQITNKKFETPLHWAARRNCLDAAKILLSHNASPHARDIAGRTPIDWAESSYNMEMLRLLKYNR